MMIARFRTLNPLSLLMILILTCSLAFAQPVGQKSRKRTTSSSKAASKKKSTKQVSKSRSRSRSSKSTAASKRSSKKRSRAQAKRGSRRGRWRSRTASAPSYHRTGIHDYLTGVWASTPAAPLDATQSGPQETASANWAGVPVQPNQAAPPANLQTANATTEATSQPGDAATDPILLNPVLAAYADSLALRGFNAENQGFIVETMDGQVLAEYNADRPFNPASVTKIATSLAVISKLGPDFKFRTSLYTDGLFDPETGTLRGSLYVIGSGDPSFFYENAMLIADKLNRNGIRKVEGNLVVLGQFYFNFSSSREASARAFRATLDSNAWTSGAKAAYPRFLSMRAAEERLKAAADNTRPASWPSSPPLLEITGETITDPAVNTTNLKLLAVHTSLPLVNVLKGLNDFSNNWMAAIIGNMVGGPPAVERFLKTELGLKDEECGLVTSSGLGSNYISPRVTVQMIRKLSVYLQKYNLGLQDILPVAGIDNGTLKRRFTDVYRGTVVGKTGTLSGVSALAGIAFTRMKGPVFFVIFNRGGSPASFRAAQDETIKKLITLFGGPAPIRYTPMSGPYVSRRGKIVSPEVSDETATADEKTETEESQSDEVEGNQN